MNVRNAKLLARFERINRFYFQSKYPLKSISWSTRPFHKIYRGYDCDACWAFFSLEEHQIVINLCLKDKCPMYVLDFLIYHECLHLYWRYHCKSFKAEEYKFKHYAKAESWLKKHQKLIKAGRS